MARSNFSGDTEDDSPEVWSKRLKKNKDYRSLAAVFNSGYPGDQQKWLQILKKMKLAKSILKEAGREAVDAIMEEITKHGGFGRDELAHLLVAIGDPKAVPVLKRMLDHGEFSHLGTSDFKRFVDRYPELQPKAEMNTCVLCGKERPVTEMHMVRPSHFFCSDTCWTKRGRIIGPKLPGAQTCPFYSEGLCTVGDGNNVCSLWSGSYTTCHVYSIQNVK